MPLLVLQPSELDPPGPLADWLTDAGARLDLRRLSAGDAVPAELDDVRGIVCLGGEMDADADQRDPAAHPWLAEVRALLRTAVSRGLPTWGICLGAQLLAAATGGRVARAERPEVGPMVVARRDAATEDPLLASLPLSPLVLQFHRDEVASLPPGAVLLAASPLCAHQMFRVGARAWGVQGHIETTPELVARWRRDAAELAAHARPGALDPEFLRAEHEDIADTWRPVAARFVQLAARPASAAGLPLSAARPGT